MKSYISRLTGSNKLLVNVNSLLVLSLTFIVIVSLILDSHRKFLIPVTYLIYAIIIILAGLNYANSSYLRKAIKYVGIILVFSLIAIFINYYFFDKYLIRIIMILIAMATLSSIKLAPRIMNLITILALFLMTYFTYRSFGYINSYSQLNIFSINDGLINPNSMALIVLFSYMIADRGKIMSKPIFRFAITIMATVGILNYKSRSSLLCLILYFILLFILRKKRIFNKELIFNIIIFFALLFPILYVGNYRSSTPLFTSNQILGKNIYSGRQNIWSQVFQNENINKLIISFPDINFINSFPADSLHNMYIDFVYNLGLPLLLIFFFATYVCVIKNRKISNKVMGAILIIFVFGFFETSFEGGTYFGMLMMLVFIGSDIGTIGNNKKILLGANNE